MCTTPLRGSRVTVTGDCSPGRVMLPVCLGSVRAWTCATITNSTNVSSCTRPNSTRRVHSPQHLCPSHKESNETFRAEYQARHLDLGPLAEFVVRQQVN